MTFISYCCESICCSCQAMSVMLMVKCDILILCRPQTDTFLRLWQGRIWAASVRPARSLRCRSLSPSQNHHTKMMVQSTYGSNCSSIILLFRDPLNFTSWFKTVCWMLNYEFKEVENSKRIKSSFLLLIVSWTSLHMNNGNIFPNPMSYLSLSMKNF